MVDGAGNADAGPQQSMLVGARAAACLGKHPCGNGDAVLDPVPDGQWLGGLVDEAEAGICEDHADVAAAEVDARGNIGDVQERDAQRAAPGAGDRGGFDSFFCRQ